VTARQRFVDGLAAAAVGAVVSGAPSTAYALATGRPLLEATEAAGSVVLSSETPRSHRALAGVAVHGAVSAWWGLVLSWALPRGWSRRSMCVGGAVAGLMIAAVDLGTVGRRVAEIRRLPLVPQIADHALFGAVCGWVLSVSRARAVERREHLG